MKKSIKLVSIVLALTLVLALAVGFVACNKKDNIPAKQTDDSVISIDDVRGKTVACIGQGAVPGLTFMYVMQQNGIEVITEGAPNSNQVLVIWAADGAAANASLVSGAADFAVVGEPAATTFSKKFGYSASMNLQEEYAKCSDNNGETYPQAGIFVKTTLAENSEFMTAFFLALAASRQWIASNKAEVTEYMQQNLYESANFPAAALDKCSVNATQVNATEKARIIAFLSNIMPSISWDSNVATLFDFTSNSGTAEFSSETVLRFAAPEGTPALAIGHMATANTTLYGATMQYAVVAPANIATEMAAGKADIVIMPINAGSRLIANGAGYKLVSVAVDGSLYMIGNK